MFLVLPWSITACSDPGGVTVEEKPQGQTVTVKGDIATLTITTTYKVGVSMVEISLHNSSQEILVPQLTKHGYCYLVSILDQSGNTLVTRDFGQDGFKNQFGSDRLSPGLAYTEFEWIYPWQLPNDFFGGRVKIEVWLSTEADQSKIYRLWGEVNLKKP